MRAFIATLAACMVQASQSNYLGNLIQENLQSTSSSKYWSLRLGKFNKNELEPIEITVDGVKMTKYVLSNENCTGKGADYSCPIGSRGLIHNTANFDVGEPDFFKPSLLNGSIEWDMDLSGAECGTIAAFTGVSMPAYNPADSHPAVRSFSDGFFYCDAMMGAFGGNYCPDVTFMEANKYTFSTTPHVCSDPDANGHYDTCDWHGAEVHTNASSKDDFGPGSDYKIDTTKPFHVKVFLEEVYGEFSGVKTTFTQGES